jgi:hypothetical protein
MRIVVISDHETVGGAATAGARLARPIALHHEMHYLVHNPDFAAHPWTTWPLRLPYATDPTNYRPMYPILNHGWRRPGPIHRVFLMNSTLGFAGCWTEFARRSSGFRISTAR